MTSTASNPPRRSVSVDDDTPMRRFGPLGATIAFLVLVIGLTLLASRYLTEYWWFSELGYSNVITTQWFSMIVLFLIGLVVMAIPVWLSAFLAHRGRPVYPSAALRPTPMDQYREAFEPLRKIAVIGVPVVLGLFAGVGAATQWQSFQVWLNAESFGQTDPQFGIDLGFYVFAVPAIQFIFSFVIVVTVLSLLVAIVMSYLYGGIQIKQGNGNKIGFAVTNAARRQLNITAAVLMLILAGRIWFSQYETLLSSTSIAQGADYTDVHAGIPARMILAAVAVVVAAMFIVCAVRGNWRLPAIGVGLMLVTAVLIGGAYPALIARFQVQPNAQELEAPYIQRNIDATRTGFGLDDMEVREYAATTTAEQGALREDAETTASIRLLDPNIVSPAFRQLQQNKQYYNFAETLAVDKYSFEDGSHDTVIGVRELNLAGLGDDQRNWVNQHTVFTHGFGVVAAYGNQVRADGSPAFYEADIPSSGRLSGNGGSTYEERIYFSPNAPDYSIVGAPEGTEPWELDYPDDSAEGQIKTTFPTDQVSVGPKLDSFLSRMLYAINMRSEQILFSDRVNSESQIIYDRAPADRVAKVAPYLTLDGRVYPAVVDEKVVWVVDGYTTSSTFPYATSQALDAATSDSLTASSSSVNALEPARVNYIRNSIKATVDAFSGEVTLYAWDEDDPVLRTWQKVFPSTVKSISEVSGDLMAHFRYPEDLFKVQRTVLSRYHVTDAASFFTAQDFWQVPFDPTTNVDESTARASLQPPYYVTLQMPTQEQSSFSLTSTFIPGGNSDRQILTGFLAADADAGNQAGVKSPDYGKLRLLVLPRNSTVPGPGQVQTKFNTDSTVAQAFTFLKQGNSTIELGNLLTLPVGGGLMYVQPVYAYSSQGSTYPLLRYVMVAFGDEIGFGTSLSDALDQVFGGDSGAETADNDGATAPAPDPAPDGDEPDATDPGTEPGTDPGTDPGAEPGPGGNGEPGTDPGTSDPGTSDPGTSSSAQDRLSTALNEMEQAWEQGQTALENGDFAAYGRAQEALQSALDRAVAAERELNAAG